MTAAACATCALVAVSAMGNVVLEPGRTEVLVAAKAPKSVLFAAADLTNHLARIFGCEVPVVSRPTSGWIQIAVGDSEWTRAVGIDVDALPHRDAFRIKTAEGRVYIAGLDHRSNDLGGDLARGVYPRREHATAFGVCEFLERYAGVRFYFPDEYGTVIPRAKSITVPPVDDTVKPIFTIRNCYLEGTDPMPDIPADDETAQRRTKAMYQLRLRENTMRIPCCHGQNSFKIADRFSKTHPEFFQLRENGTRCTETVAARKYYIGQLCHTSPVWDIFREETIDRIRHNWKYVDLMPQDGMKACRCANCLARYDQTNDLTLASGFCSTLIWSNTVAVAKAVKAAGLDGCVTQMAYGPSRNIPDFDIPDNVKVVLAVGGPWACSRPDVLDWQIDFIRKWSEKIGGRVAWVWMYPMKNYWRLQAHAVPQHAPHAYHEFFRRAAKYMDGAYLESNADNDTIFYQYLNYYVFSKFAWNPDIDVDAILDEHDRLLFGRGANHVRKFLDRVEELWIGKIAIPSMIPETEHGEEIWAPKEMEIYRDIYSDSVMKELEGCFAAARRAVRRGSAEARRIDTLHDRFLSPLVARRREAFSKPQSKQGR